MGTETIDKLCCNCIYYLHGQLENPCAKNSNYVGYLREGCWRWKSEKGEDEVYMKRCSRCGEELPTTMFARYKKQYTNLCKNCNEKRLEEWRNAIGQKKKKDMD